MSISIREAFGQNLNNPNIPISSKRLNKILKSTSLEEATSMGLIDRLFDRFFRNGGKRETITRLYEQVASADSPSLKDMPEIKMGLRFNTLRQLANEEYRGEFKTRVINSGSNEWSFSFEIGNHVIYQSDFLSRTKNEDCFQALCALKITQNFENDLYSYRAVLSNKDNLVEIRLDTMSDDPVLTNFLRSHRDDETFSKKNLKEVTDLPMEVEDQGQNARCFMAKFASKEILFSNRPGTNGEFRGDVLKQALLERNYANLAELCSSDFMTEKDTRLIYMAQPHKIELIQLLATDTDSLNSHGLDTLKSMLSLSVGEMKTTLCKLFKMEEPQRFPSFVHDLLDEVSLGQVS